MCVPVSLVEVDGGEMATKIDLFENCALLSFSSLRSEDNSSFGKVHTRSEACMCVQVLIVEDENGEIVRETMKDSDAIIMYKVRGPMCPFVSIRSCVLASVDQYS